MKQVSLFLALLFLLSPLTAVSAASEEKLVALTFDDGPHPKNTEKLLGLLDEFEISATFFVIGQNIEYFPKVFEKLADSRHEIGNHTYSHPKLIKESPEGLAEELARCEQAIARYGREKCTLFRPPEGVRNAVVASVTKEKGYRSVYWNLDTLDWTGRSADAIVQTITSGVKNGSIILCHDYIVGGGHTVEALARVIPKLLKEGYRFVTVSELLTLTTARSA